MITSHINHKSGCPVCKNGIPWTLKRFLDKSKEIHGDKYDYSNVNKYTIENSKYYINIICNKCLNNWNVLLYHHIYDKSGCPICSKSKLENIAFSCLKKLNIEYYDTEYIPNELKFIKCFFRFDFYFIYNNITYFLELDGIQHFMSNSFFDKIDNLEYRQLKDRFKTQFVLLHPDNYRILRIDYTCKTFDDMFIFIQKSLAIEEKICLYSYNL